MQTALVVALLLTLMLGQAEHRVGAQGRPLPVAPFQAETDGHVILSDRLLPPGGGVVIQSGTGDAAEWLMAQQIDKGGGKKCFPRTKGSTVCPSNTQGPTARGLLMAYERTGDADHLAAAVATGKYLVPNYPQKYGDGDPRFATHDPLFLEHLSAVTGDSDYADFVQEYFWDKLADEQYGPSNDWDALEFGLAVVDARQSQGVVEIAPWDLSATAIAAEMAGETDIRDDLMAAILEGLERTTLPADHDLIGLAGAIWASAVTGVNLDPEDGAYEDADTTEDLVEILLDYQRESDGAWLWGTEADPEDPESGDTQTTAYAILALEAFGEPVYLDEIVRGSSFLISVQEDDGQILMWPGAPEDWEAGVQVHAEAMQALSVSRPSLDLQVDKSVFCGEEEATLTIDVTKVAFLYGLQFVVSYDPDLVAADGRWVTSFFDVDGDGVVPEGWDAECEDGMCRFAKSEAGDGPVSGSGSVAEITFTPLEPGTFDVTLSDNVLSDSDGLPIDHDVFPETLEITVCGFASASGNVSLQGRAKPRGTAPSDPAGKVTLTDPEGRFGPYEAEIDGDTGAWSISNIRVMPTGTSYNFLAMHSLYLGNAMARELGPDESYVAPNTRLRGGDANNSSQVDIADLACIGGAFGGPGQSCGGGNSDINWDGKTNILDLAITGSNYGKSGPQAW